MKLDSPVFKIVSLTLILTLISNSIAVTCPGLDASALQKFQPINLASKPLGNMDPGYVGKELGIRSELRSFDDELMRESNRFLYHFSLKAGLDDFTDSSYPFSLDDDFTGLAPAAHLLAVFGAWRLGYNEIVLVSQLDEGYYELRPRIRVVYHIENNQKWIHLSIPERIPQNHLLLELLPKIRKKVEEVAKELNVPLIDHAIQGPHGEPLHQVLRETFNEVAKSVWRDSNLEIKPRILVIDRARDGTDIVRTQADFDLEENVLPIKRTSWGQITDWKEFRQKTLGFLSALGVTGKPAEKLQFANQFAQALVKKGMFPESILPPARAELRFSFQKIIQNAYQIIYRALTYFPMRNDYFPIVDPQHGHLNQLFSDREQILITNEINELYQSRTYSREFLISAVKRLIPVADSKLEARIESFKNENDVKEPLVKQVFLSFIIFGFFVVLGYFIWGLIFPDFWVGLISAFGICGLWYGFFFLNYLNSYYFAQNVYDKSHLKIPSLIDEQHQEEFKASFRDVLKEEFTHWKEPTQNFDPFSALFSDGHKYSLRKIFSELEQTGNYSFLELEAAKSSLVLSEDGNVPEMALYALERVRLFVKRQIPNYDEIVQDVKLRRIVRNVGLSLMGIFSFYSCLIGNIFFIGVIPVVILLAMLDESYVGDLDRQLSSPFMQVYNYDRNETVIRIPNLVGIQFQESAQRIIEQALQKEKNSSTLIETKKDYLKIWQKRFLIIFAGSFLLCMALVSATLAFQDAKYVKTFEALQVVGLVVTGMMGLSALGAGIIKGFDGRNLSKASEVAGRSELRSSIDQSTQTPSSLRAELRSLEKYPTESQRESLKAVVPPDASRAELRRETVGWFHHATVWGLRLAYSFAFAWSLSFAIPSVALQYTIGATLALLVDLSFSKYYEILRMPRDKNIFRTFKEIAIFILPVVLLVQHWVATTLPYFSYGYFASLGVHLVGIIIIISQSIFFMTFLIKISRNPNDEGRYPWHYAAVLLRLLGFVYFSQSFSYANLVYFFRLGFEPTTEIIILAASIGSLIAYYFVKSISYVISRFLYKPFKISPKIIAIASALSLPVLLLYFVSSAAMGSDAFQEIQVTEKASWLDTWLEWGRLLSFPLLVTTFIACQWVKKRISFLAERKSENVRDSLTTYTLDSLEAKMKSAVPERLARFGIPELNERDALELVAHLIQSSQTGEELAYKFETLGLIDELPNSQMQAVTFVNSAMQLWQKSDLNQQGQYPFSTNGNIAFPEVILESERIKIHFHGFAHTAAFDDEVKALVAKLNDRERAGLYLEEGMKFLFRGEEAGIDMKDQTSLFWPVFNRLSFWNRLKMLFEISGFMTGMIAEELKNSFPNLIYYLLTGREMPGNGGMNLFTENGKSSIFQIWLDTFQEQRPQPLEWTLPIYFDRNNLYDYVEITRSAAMMDFMLRDAKAKGLQEIHWIGGLWHQSEMIWMALHREDLNRFMRKADHYYPEVNLNESAIQEEVRVWVNRHVTHPLQPYIFVDMKALTKNALRFDSNSNQWVPEVVSDENSVWMGGISELKEQFSVTEEDDSHAAPPVLILVGTDDSFSTQSMNAFVTQSGLPADYVRILPFESLQQEGSDNLLARARRIASQQFDLRKENAGSGLILHVDDSDRAEALSDDFNVIFKFDPKGAMVKMEDLKRIAEPPPQEPLTRREQFGNWIFSFFYPELNVSDDAAEEFAAPVDFKDTVDQLTEMLQMQANLPRSSRDRFYVNSIPVSVRVIERDDAQALTAGRSELRSSGDNDDGDDGSQWQGSQDDDGDGDNMDPMLASTSALQILDHGALGREIFSHVIPKGSQKPTLVIHIYSRAQSDAGYFFYVAKMDERGRITQPTEYIKDEFAAVQRIEPYLTALAQNPEVQRELRDHASEWQNLATLFALPASWKNIIQGFADTDDLDNEPEGEFRLEAIEDAVRETIQAMLDDESFDMEFLRWIVDDGFSVVTERMNDVSSDLVDRLKGELSRRGVLEQNETEYYSAIAKIAHQLVREDGGFRASDVTYEGHILKVDQKSARTFLSEGTQIIELRVPAWHQHELKILIQSNGDVVIKRSWVKGDRRVNLDNSMVDIDRITSLFESEPSILNALRSKKQWRILLRKEFRRNLPIAWLRVIDLSYENRSELRMSESDAQLLDLPEPPHWIDEVFDPNGNFDERTLRSDFNAEIRNAMALFSQDENQSRRVLDRLVLGDSMRAARVLSQMLGEKYVTIASEYLTRIAQSHPKEVANLLVGIIRNKRIQENVQMLLVDLARTFGREVINPLVGALADPERVSVIKATLFKIAKFNAERVSKALIAALQDDARREVAAQILFELVELGYENFVRNAAEYAINNQFTSAPFATAFLKSLDSRSDQSTIDIEMIPSKQNTAQEEAARNYLRNLKKDAFVGLNATARRFHIPTSSVYTLLTQHGFRIAFRLPDHLADSPKKRQEKWFVKVERSDRSELRVEAIRTSDLRDISEAAQITRSVLRNPNARSELRKVFDDLDPTHTENPPAMVYDRRFIDLGFAPALAAHAIMNGKPVGLIVATRSELRMIAEINAVFGKIQSGNKQFDPILVADTPERAAKLMRSELRLSAVHYIYPEGYGISPQLGRFFARVVEFKRSAMRYLEFNVQGFLEARMKAYRIAERIAQMA